MVETWKALSVIFIPMIMCAALGFLLIRAMESVDYHYNCGDDEDDYDDDCRTEKDVIILLRNGKEHLIDWEEISENIYLSESFIRKFHDKVDWEAISGCQKLSESLIREFQDKVDWYYISNHQRLSESFIREFQDKVDWSEISDCQKLSCGFRQKFHDKL